MTAAAPLDDVLTHNMLDNAKKKRWNDVFLTLQRVDRGRGADGTPRYVDYRPYPRRYGLIHFAVLQGRLDVVDRLLGEFSANMDLRTVEGQTALEIAQDAKNLSMVRLLENSDLVGR